MRLEVGAVYVSQCECPRLVRLSRQERKTASALLCVKVKEPKNWLVFGNVGV